MHSNIYPQFPAGHALEDIYQGTVVVCEYTQNNSPQSADLHRRFEAGDLYLVHYLNTVLHALVFYLDIPND
jgi:hypothetical protein